MWLYQYRDTAFFLLLCSVLTLAPRHVVLTDSQGRIVIMYIVYGLKSESVASLTVMGVTKLQISTIPHVHTHQCFSDRVVSFLQVSQQLPHHRLSIRMVAHGVEEVDRSLAYAHVTLRLHGPIAAQGRDVV